MADKVAKMVKEKPLVIFSKSTSCMSHTIKDPLQRRDSQGKEVEQNLGRRGYNPTVPVVFIGCEFGGRANEVMSLHIDRFLVSMLKRAGALWLWKDDRL